MLLNIDLFDSNGRNRPGIVRLNLDFKDKKWSVDEDNLGKWSSVSSRRAGQLEGKGGGDVAMVEFEPGKLPRSLVILAAIPQTERGLANAGSGRIVAADDPAFVGGAVFWGFERSSIRQAMLRLLHQCVPFKEMSSDMPGFKTLTDFDTARLKKDFWENEEHPNKTFTTCNLFVGAMVRKLGDAVGKEPGPRLKTGPLKLKLADNDVPGSFVEPQDGKAPQEGDIYCVSRLVKGWLQEFGHVGFIGKIEGGIWVSVDGGQGGYKKGFDVIKWSDPKPFDPLRLRGWVDIDRYFGTWDV